MMAPRQATSLRQTHIFKNERGQFVVSDWEGEFVFEDNAARVTQRIVPNGDKVFAAISEYDDYVSYIRRQEGYQPGDTLALIAPFLVTYGLTEKKMQEISKEGANFIKGSLEAINVLQKNGVFHVVSTSYEQYIECTASLAGVPLQNTTSTKFPIEKLKESISLKDKQLVIDMVPKILKLEKLGICASSTEKDIPASARETISTMDNFFWEVLPKTSFASLIRTVKPVGGERKLDALKEVLKRENRSIKRATVVGDSITDHRMLHETRKEGGLAIAFNGNSYAIRNANVAVATKDTRIIPVLAQIFERTGIQEIKQVTSNWNFERLRQEHWAGNLDKELFVAMQELNVQAEFPIVRWITNENVEDVIKVSKTYRNSVRGTAFASLG